MTKANELVDARINFISFVKKGANGDPLRILKSEDGAGIDLASLNKTDDTPVKDDVAIPVAIPKNDPVPEADKAPVIAEEVIQKLNLMAIARNVQQASRYARQGARAGYRFARQPSIPRNLQTAVGHIVRSGPGAAGVAVGATAGRIVTAGANRIARARQAGRRVAMGLRAGYGLAREVGRVGTRRAQTSRAAEAWLRARSQGARRSLRIGEGAGIAASHAQHRARQLRTWVTNARVNGGGFWRRNT